MSVIRGGLLVIASVLIFIGFLLMNSLLVVSNSLEYKNIQNELVPVVIDFIGERVNLSNVVDAKFPLMKEYCENNSEFVFNEKEFTFEVSCDSIEQGSEAIIEEIIRDFVDDIYYRDYDCGFIDCFNNGEDIPYFLISENTKNYFENKFYFILSLLFVMAVIMFFLIENKTNFPILLGSLLIVSSFPFMKLNNLISFFAEKSFLNFFTFLFTESYSVAIKVLIFGVFLLLLGIVLKFFKIGFWVSDFISRFSKRQRRGSAPNPNGSNKTEKLSSRKISSTSGK